MLVVSVGGDVGGVALLVVGFLVAAVVVPSTVGATVTIVVVVVVVVVVAAAAMVVLVDEAAGVVPRFKPLPLESLVQPTSTAAAMQQTMSGRLDRNI